VAGVWARVVAVARERVSARVRGRSMAREL